MNPIKTLFILFSLYTIHHSLLARDALPVLVEEGEPFENRNNFYIPDQSSINTIAISPNGKILVFGSRDKSIKIWDVKSGKELKILEGHKNSVKSLAISPNGKTIVSGSWDNSIKIWDIESAKEIMSLKGHTDTVLSIAISSNEKIIVSGSRDNSIKIWDIESGKEINSLNGHGDYVSSVAISPDMKTIVSGSGDNSIKIWDIESGEELNSLEGHTDSVSSVAISPDGKTVVSGSADKSIKIWDKYSGKELKRLDGHGDYVSSISISPNGKIIVSGSSDESIKIWDIQSGKELKSLDRHRSWVNSISIFPDGKTIVSSSRDGRVFFWDSKTGKTIKELVAGQNGTWAVFDYQQKKVFRGDDGTLLYKKNGEKSILALPKLPIKDSVNINSSSHIRVINDSIYTYLVSVENISNELLYWIKSSYQDKYCSVSEERLSNIKAQEKKILKLTFNCLLPRENPKPIENHNINLVFETATGTNFTIPISISIGYADINITKVEKSEDKKNLNILLHNSGNEKLLKAKVQLLEPFLSNIIEITDFEANSSKSISFSIDEYFDNNATLAMRIYLPDEKNINNIPLYEWQIDNITISLNKTAWYIYLLWILSILLLLSLIFYYKIFKNPLIIDLSKKPKTLKTLNPTQLKEANLKLKSINRLETTLDLANISKENFEKTLLYFKSQNDKKAELFAERIGAIECKKKGNFYQITMGDDFNLNNIRTFLLYITDKNIEEIKREVLSLNDKVFVIGSEEHQNSVVALAQDKTNRLMATTVGGFSELMLSHDAESIFIKILSQSLSLKDISPYQLNGDVKNESNFFGRVEILREIISNSSVNYLIVGARQLGKSSILKALERRYEGSREINYYSFTLDESGDLLGAMSEVLGLGDEVGLDEIVVAIRALDKKPIFLIDEADMFVKYEKERGYYITSVFRKLSQEGEAMFIMAGFWTLYEYVSLDYQSPLKNFGKLITLEGLEFEACRELMIEPMGRIGVRYESDRIIDEVIELCGRRANYIAIVCDVVLQQLEGSVIGGEDIESALDSRAVDRMIKDWESLSANREKNRLDRLIVYLTIEKERFRLGDVTRSIKEQGLKIDIERINESLDRLVLGYVIGKSKGDYFYQIPLLKQKLLEDDLEILIEGEVDGLVDKS